MCPSFKDYLNFRAISYRAKRFLVTPDNQKTTNEQTTENRTKAKMSLTAV